MAKNWWQKIMSAGAVLLVGAILLSGVGGNMPLSVPEQVGAQDEAPTCESVVRDALRMVGSACVGLGQNEACYGNARVQLIPRDDVQILSFENAGDTVPLQEIRALYTDAYDPERNTWGVALMTVLADLPENSSETMTFMLLGDAAIEDATVPGVVCRANNSSPSTINVRSGPSTDNPVLFQADPGDNLAVTGLTADGWLRVQSEAGTAWTSADFYELSCPDEQRLPTVSPDDIVSNSPMQVIRLDSNPDSFCSDAPNGLLIQSPEGQRANIIINGVEMSFASAGFINIDENGLNVTGLAGEIEVTVPEGARAGDFETERPGSADISSLGESSDDVSETANEGTDSTESTGTASVEGDENSVGNTSVADLGNRSVTILPGLSTTIGQNEDGTLQAPTPPDLREDTSELLPAYLDVAANGTDYDEAVIRATGDITRAQELLDQRECGVGGSFTIDLPIVANENDPDPVLSVTYVGGSTVAGSDILLASRRDFSTLQVNCLNAGSQILIVTLAQDDGTTLNVGVVVYVRGEGDPRTDEPNSTRPGDDDDDDDASSTRPNDDDGDDDDASSTRPNDDDGDDGDEGDDDAAGAKPPDNIDPTAVATEDRTEVNR